MANEKMFLVVQMRYEEDDTFRDEVINLVDDALADIGGVVDDVYFDTEYLKDN